MGFPPLTIFSPGKGGKSINVVLFPTIGERPPEVEGAAPLGDVRSADSAAVPGVTSIAREVERASDELRLMYRAQGPRAF